MDISTIYKRFPTEADCYAFFEQQRWGDHPVCPYCGSNKNSRHKDGKRHHCSSCNRSFSVLVGTVMQATKLPLQKWLLAITIMLNAKKGIAARQLARDLGTHHDTAWLLQMRIRSAMAEISEWMQGSGLVSTPRKTAPRRPKGPIPPAIQRIRQRGQELATTLKSRYGPIIRPAITQTLQQKNPLPVEGQKVASKLVESPFSGARYFPIRSIEGFWFLLKRGLLGQYHQLHSTYLQAYMDEFAFKYNHRRNPDIFDLMINRITKERMPQSRTSQ